MDSLSNKEFVFRKTSKLILPKIQAQGQIARQELIECSWAENFH